MVFFVKQQVKQRLLKYWFWYRIIFFCIETLCTDPTLGAVNHAHGNPDYCVMHPTKIKLLYDPSYTLNAFPK